MRTHSLAVPLLAVAALEAAVITGGKTWPLVAAQALLGAAWLFARQLRSGSGPVLFWVIPAGLIVVFGMAAVPSSAENRHIVSSPASSAPANWPLPRQPESPLVISVLAVAPLRVLASSLQGK
jgi:hypothetical protein